MEVTKRICSRANDILKLLGGKYEYRNHMEESVEMKIHKESPWVSVKDRLPEPHETVLVCGLFTQVSSTAIEEVPGCELNRRLTQEEQKRMARYAHGMFDKYGFPNHGKQKYEVRYWMPIPDFPKEYV